MADEITKFVKLNKLKLENFHKKKILIADRSLPEAVLINSLAAYSLNQNYKFDAELITDVGKKNKLLEIYESFNIKNIHYMSLKYNLRSIFLIINTLLYFILSYTKIIFLGNYWFIKKFTIKDIYFGDLFYDTFIKKNLNYLKNNLISIDFAKILFFGIYKINFIDRLLTKNKYETILSSTTNATSASAITTKIALKKKIKVLYLLSNDFVIFNNLQESYRGVHNMTKKKLINAIKKDKNWEKKINLYIKKRFKGLLLDRDARIAYKNKKNFTKIEFLKKINLSKKYKRIGFFAPHSFHDTSYIMGKIIHLNLYDHFIQTIKILKKSTDTLWIVKPHPASQFYYGSNIANDYLNSLNYDHIVKCPNYLSNETIIKIADIIVTCRGTIGLEAGIFGKKTVLAGEAYYSDLKTSYKPKNNHDYRNYLLNNKINFKLSKKQIRLCKMAFYNQIFKNSLIDSKIIPLDKFVDIDLKKSKVQHRRYTFDRVNFKSYKNYLKIVNKKIVKKNFLKDEFYIKLNTWIKNQKFKIKN